jgi:hypothetical protein
MITSPGEIGQLLVDLRGMPLVDPTLASCDGSWTPDTALITLHQDRWFLSTTFAVRFDNNCGQVVAGTGTAAIATPQLRADIVRLVPNSGLQP